MYDVEVFASPSQRAIQMRSGSWYLPGCFIRAWSRAQMPEPALE